MISKVWYRSHCKLESHYTRCNSSCYQPLPWKKNKNEPRESRLLRNRSFFSGWLNNRNETLICTQKCVSSDFLPTNLEVTDGNEAQ